MLSRSTSDSSLTVIILTRDRLRKLQAVLRRLLPQLGNDDRVLVVDTGSNDGTRQWLATQAPPVASVEFSSAAGDFAAARNFAVAQVSTALAAFLDDDCIPAPDWVPRLRSALDQYDAVGGIVLPGFLYRYPRWWSGEIAWCAGMSPAGVLEQRRDNYPATANLGARRSVFTQVPFASLPTPLQDERRYLAGREDASWWTELRRRGFRCAIEPRLVVFHAVPDDRFRARAVFQRARWDAAAAYLRSPSDAAVALEKDSFIESVADVIAHPLRQARGGLPALAAKALWLCRQEAWLSAACAGDSPGGRLGLASRILRRAARKVAGETVLRVRRALRPGLAVPDPPLHILLAAPTFLGDTVLLLSVVDLLARNWPEANIVVWTRYPDLFSPQSPLVTIERFGQESEERVARYALWGSQVTFVPYYHFGSQKLWRRVLSLRAVTFTHDVGFAKTSDYFFAPRLVPKRFDQHEIINLLDLISLWPLARSLQPPGLDPQDEEFARLSERYPVLNERPYVTIHIDSSLEMKRWPEDRWEFVARRLAEETGALCCFIGAPATHDKAQVLCERLAPHATLNMCRLDLPELIALIAHARLAVGTCSGPKHLAYALRTPTFTLYGPESERRWGAWCDRPLHGYMSAPVEYLSPREHAGLPPNHLMRLIPAEAAAEAIVAHYRRIDRAH